MSASTPTRIRVILTMIQIHDSLEAPGDDEGEFRFKCTVSSGGKVLQETQLPREKKFYRISENPAWNRLQLNEPLFEGEVADHMEVEILGEEVDLLTSNDQLTPYRRVFEGDPESWLGLHAPGDEGSNDPERMKDWWVYLTVERA